MAENKNALANETANETGNAALTERLDDVAERMAEAEKATAAVAEEQKQRLAEQEQNSEQLQKAEEERRAQAAENAKSVADRRAAVLDYTENYRQNQKIEKAARATVSKAKMERLAAEAEAKAKAEREAEEALQREREELMARRQRSSELLKKVDNDSETKAPEAKAPEAAPAKEAMPKAAPAPAPAVENAAPAAAKPEENAPAEQIPALDETPDIPDVDFQVDLSEEAPVADDAASAEENAPEAVGSDDVNEALSQLVDNDLERVAEEAKAQQERGAEVAEKVDEDLVKTRVAQMMPARLIPEGLRLYKTSDKEKYNRKAKLRSPAKLPDQAEIDKALKNLEDAVSAAEKNSEARLAAALDRVNYMTNRAQETADRLGASDSASAAPQVVKAVNVGDAQRKPSNAAIAAAAVGSGTVADSVLPEVYDAEEFTPSKLKSYLKGVKKEIKAKKRDVAQTTKEDGESKADFERRRMERRASLLGLQLGNIALLSRKGYADEAEKFMGDAEDSVDLCNQSIEKYNRVANESIEPLPDNIVARVARDGRLPELPFGSAATGLDAALRGGAYEADEEAQPNKRAQEKALRKEMQKEMLLHAMEWNPEAASDIKDKVDEYTAEKAEKKKRKQQRKAAKAAKAEKSGETVDATIAEKPVETAEEKAQEKAAKKLAKKSDKKSKEKSDEAFDEKASEDALRDAHHVAARAEREGRPADEEGRSSDELFEAYKETVKNEKRGRKKKDGASSDELYATYLATVAEEKREKREHNAAKREERKEKRRVSHALHDAYISAEKDASADSNKKKNRISDALGSAYAEALEEEKKSPSTKKKKKSKALEAAYLAAREEEENASKKNKEESPSETLRAAYLASDKVEKKNNTADGEDSVSRSLKAAYHAAEEKEKDENADTADVLESAYFAAREEEKKNDSSNDESSASDVLFVAYLKAKEDKKQKRNEKKSKSEELHAAYEQALEEEKNEKKSKSEKHDSEEEDKREEKKKRSEELHAAYKQALEEEESEKKSKSEKHDSEEEDKREEKKKRSEELHAAYEQALEKERNEKKSKSEKHDSEEEEEKEENEERSEEIYASYLAALAEEKQEEAVSEDRDASDEESDAAEEKASDELTSDEDATDEKSSDASDEDETDEDDEDDEDEFDGDWDSWEENYAKDMPRTAKTIREMYHEIKPERKKQLEELQRRFLYEQMHATDGDKNFPAEDIYKAKEDHKKAEAVLEKAENHFASKETIANIQRIKEEYVAATKREEWIPDVKETEKSIRETLKEKRAQQLATERLIKAQEESIRAAAEEAKKEADLALDRITKDYEKQIRAAAEAERENILFAKLQASDAEKAAAEADRLAAKEERRAKLLFAKEYSDEMMAVAALAAASKKAEHLAAEADRTGEKLEKLRLAKEVSDKSTTLSLERKTEMLTLAMDAASGMQDVDAERRMRKQVALLAKKEVRAATKEEKKRRERIAHFETEFAEAEAAARAATQEVERLESEMIRLHADNSDQDRMRDAYNELLRENAKAEEARHAAEIAKEKLDAENALADQKREAKEAMLAFAAAMGAKKVGKTKLTSTRQKSRYLTVAIENAERSYDRAMLAIANADDRALYLKETNAPESERELLNQARARLSLNAAYAEEKLNALRATREVLDTSTVMSKNEKAELLSMAIAVADTEDHKAVERLNKRVAVFVRKEEAAARRADRSLALNMHRWDKRVASEEAKARIAEKSARAAKAKVERLSLEKAEKLHLSEAYEQALLAEALAKDARKNADEAKAERDAKRERANSHKEAKAALLAFAGTYAVSEKRKSKDSKKKQDLSEADQQKLDAAIVKAEESCESAAKAENVSKERSKELLNASREDRQAAKQAKRLAKQEKLQAEDHLDTLQAAKNAVEKSNVLSREEKAEMIDLVTEAEKGEKRKKAIKKLQKKIAAAAKKEARAAKVVAREEKRYAVHCEKTTAEAEALALHAESKAIAARAKADELFATKANAKTLQKAYNRALLEEAKADRARTAFNGAQARLNAGRELVAEHEEAKEAMLAFAAAVALEEKNKRTKKTKSTSAAPMKSERKLDAAIAKANAHYERAEASFNAIRDSLLRVSEQQASEAELQEIYSTFARFEIEKTRAKNELETLESAKRAIRKTHTLTSTEKDDMIALLLRAKEEKREKSEAATRLKKTIDLAARREEIEARRASKKNDRKAKRLEKAYLANMAKALAAEEIAKDSKQRAIYLTSQKANKKELYKAYREALLEQTKAENAKRTSDQLEAKLSAVTERADTHKDAKMALLAFAAAFAAEEKAKKKKDRRPAKTVADLKATYLDTAISEAENSYEEALANSTASKLSARVLDEKRVSSKKLAEAYKEALLAEDKATRAKERIQSLRAARAVAEKSTGLSEEEKADMLAFIAEENSRQKEIKKAEKLQKRSRDITEQLRPKNEKTWEESIAQYEADALVKEDAATRLANKLEEIRAEVSNRKALEKAYKDALIEEAQAEKARKKADAARIDHRADEVKKERAAALALAAKRKSEKSERNAARAVKRTVAEADMYARACEAKAELSSKKALLLASKTGRKNEKLKAYELALLDRYTAVQARAEAEKMKSEGVSEKAVAESRKERKLREAIEKNARVYDKALEKLQQKQEKEAARRAKKSGAVVDSGEASAESAQDAGKTRLDKKLEKEVLARDKKQSEIEEKIRKADEKAQARAEAAKNNPRLAAKLRYEALKAQRKRIADEKAWELLIKRDEAQDRHDSYMRALYQEKKDLERIAAKAAAPVEAPAAAPAPEAKPAISAIFGRREKVRRFKAFRKLDLEVLTDRYDYEIAEILRELELTLSDFTCTPTMRRRAEYEAKRKVAMLKQRKREALRQQKADNRRYMACLRARSFAPKNRHADSAELVQMRNQFFELLEQKNAENERLKSLCCPDAYRGAKKVATPWHKAFLKEKKRWQKKCRKQFELIEELNLSRTEKQKLRAELDRFATSYADIAEAKVRARKMKVRGMAKLRYKQELLEIKQEVRRSRRRMKQKFKAAAARSNHRNFWIVSLLYLAITILIAVDAVVIWWIFGEDITSFLSKCFSGLMSLLK